MLRYDSGAVFVVSLRIRSFISTLRRLTGFGRSVPSCDRPPRQDSYSYAPRLSVRARRGTRSSIRPAPGSSSRVCTPPRNVAQRSVAETCRPQRPVQGRVRPGRRVRLPCAEGQRLRHEASRTDPRSTRRSPCPHRVLSHSRHVQWGLAGYLGRASRPPGRSRLAATKGRSFDTEDHPCVVVHRDGPAPRASVPASEDPPARVGGCRRAGGPGRVCPSTGQTGLPRIADGTASYTPGEELQRRPNSQHLRGGGDLLSPPIDGYASCSVWR